MTADEFLKRGHAQRVADVFNRLHLGPEMLADALVTLCEEFGEIGWCVEDGQIVASARKRSGRARSGVGGVTQPLRGNVTQRA